MVEKNRCVFLSTSGFIYSKKTWCDVVRTSAFAFPLESPKTSLRQRKFECQQVLNQALLVMHVDAVAPDADSTHRKTVTTNSGCYFFVFAEVGWREIQLQRFLAHPFSTHPSLHKTKLHKLISASQTMLCTTTSPAINRRDGFLSLVMNGASTAASNGVGSQRAKADSGTVVSFSWSDFPVYDQDPSSQAPPPMVEIEDSWSTGDSSTDSSFGYSSDDSVSRHSAVSINSLEDEVCTKKEDQRKVRFSSVLSIRTFDVTLGEHPCCVGGMALTCGWTHAEDDECIDLDVYERFAPKRSMHELRLSYQERRRRLEAATGLSPAELLQLEYEMMCSEPMHILRPSGSVKSLHDLSADL